MQKHLFLKASLAIGIVSMFWSGCSEPPIACFTPSKTLVDVNEVISFENCSEPVGKSYRWDFGDGTTSTEVNPTHAYTPEGQYIVGLTAKAVSSVNDDVTKTLVIAGQRIYASATLNSLPATNPSGGPWDAADNPDIAVRFTVSGDFRMQTSTLTDVALVFPMNLPTPPPPMLVLSPVTWTVTVLDIDGPAEEVMATFTVNLATFVPTAAKTIVLEQGSAARLTVAYTLR
jgi:PKD repeat protein